MSKNPNEPEKKFSGFQLLMLVLSAYVLGALFIDTVFKLSPEVALLLQRLDTIICFIFLGDFFYRLYHAENRIKFFFLKWGWIDLISSIPMMDSFRWGRIVRIVRILRSIRSAKYILTVLFENKAKGTFSIVVLFSFVLVIFSSIVILNVETAPNSMIKTSSDALWWAVSTISTAGYGDMYPVTAAGRIMGAVLMIAGVGFFGTLTAYIASVFLGGDKKKNEAEPELAKELRLLRERLESLETKFPQAPVKLPAQFGTPPEKE